MGHLGNDVRVQIDEDLAHFESIGRPQGPWPALRFIDKDKPCPQDEIPTFSPLDREAIQWIEARGKGDLTFELHGYFVPRNLAAVRLLPLQPAKFEITLKPVVAK
jgi:hypothetical protein